MKWTPGENVEDGTGVGQLVALGGLGPAEFSTGAAGVCIGLAGFGGGGACCATCGVGGCGAGDACGAGEVWNGAG